VSYLVSGVIDTVHQWSALSLTPLTKKSDLKVECLVIFESIYETALTCDTAYHKKSDLKVGELESIHDTALTPEGPELFD
jgi:hypothetical protein